MSDIKVWYITGASKGIGFSLAKQLLANGQMVAATSRSVNAFKEFDGNEKFLALEVNLKNDESVAKSISSTIEKFGRLDVLVNNAGYGLGGALEELSSSEIAENFDVNFFAVVRVIQKALPYMRKQRSGHIFNISSIAGFAPGVGWAVYCASKFAVSGLSEGLATDLLPLGIRVTNVLPGQFRTNFAKPDSIAYSKTKLEDYSHLREYHEKIKQVDGLQRGDPDKMAEIFIEVAGSANPPLNLFLGSDAVSRTAKKIEELTGEMDTWKQVSLSADFIS